LSQSEKFKNEPGHRAGLFIGAIARCAVALTPAPSIFFSQVKGELHDWNS